MSLLNWMVDHDQLAPLLTFPLAAIAIAQEMGIDGDTIRRALAAIGRLRGENFTMAAIPAEDPAVYELISRSDTVGVFQIASRALSVVAMRHWR